MSDMSYASYADAVTANVWLDALLVLVLAANLHEKEQMFIYASAMIGSGICQRPLTHLCSLTGAPSCRRANRGRSTSMAARHVRLLAASDGRVSTLLRRSKGLVSAIKLMPAPRGWGNLDRISVA
jgi:hypothetical protein